VSVVHLARARIYQEKRPTGARSSGIFPIRFATVSIRGSKHSYKIEPEEELPSTLDHLVGAAAG